jgi:hypothetical protein
VAVYVTRRDCVTVPCPTGHAAHCKYSPFIQLELLLVKDLQMQRMQARLPRWIRTSTPRAREIVLEVLKSSYPAALPSQDIYQRALKEYPEDKVPIPPPLPSPRLGVTIKSSKKRAKQEWKPPPEPPHPDHPVRSLKSVNVLSLTGKQLKSLEDI